MLDKSIKDVLGELTFRADRLCRAWEARRKLDSGSRGMGDNILVEQAAYMNSISGWAQLKKAVDEASEALKELDK